MSVKVANIRFEPYDVYIGRAGKGQDGKWGNPFPITELDDRNRSIAKYKKWLWNNIDAGKISLKELADLDGKTLGCFCKPNACHGDILAEAILYAVEQLKKEGA